jgi:cytochrome c oxidase subunit 2
MNFRSVFDRVFGVESVIAGAVFALVVAAMVFGLVRYRAGRRAAANQNTEHTKVEALYAFGLLIVAVALYVFTYSENGRESLHKPAAVTIAVTGFQWCWKFHYAAPAVTVTGDCLYGHYPQLVVPTGRPVRFLVRSDDVIHAFWIPHVRFKIDAFPHHTNTFETVFDRPGTWSGHCAEFCGEEHATMLFTVHAVPPAQFRQWQAQAASAGASS